MLFEEGLIPVLLLALWVYCIFDVIASDDVLVRNLPKGVWLILVLILPLIGSLAWLLLGRPEKAHWSPGSSNYAAPRRPVLPWAVAGVGMAVQSASRMKRRRVCFM